MPQRRLAIFNSMSGLKRGTAASAERVIMIRSLSAVYLTILEERLRMNATMSQRRVAKVLGVGGAMLSRSPAQKGSGHDAPRAVFMT